MEKSNTKLTPRQVESNRRNARRCAGPHSDAAPRSPALRDSALAPVHPQWISVVRHEYTIDRLIERKLKLLTQIQRARKNQERTDAEAEDMAEK